MSREDYRKGLLTFKRTDDRLDSFPVLLLLYPSPAFARLVDPLKLVLDAGSGEPLPLGDLLSLARERINPLIPSRVDASVSTAQPSVPM